MNIELRICNFRIEKRLINLTSARHYCQPEALSNLDKTLEGQLLHQYIFSLIAQSKEITWYHPDLLFTAYVLIYNSGYSLLTLQILYQSGQLWIEPLLHYTLEIWQDGLYLGETTLTRCPDLLLLYEDRPWQIYEFKSKKNYYNSAQLAFTQLPFRLQHRPLEYTLITPNTVQSLDKPLYTSYLALFIKSGVRLFRLNPYTLFHNIYIGNLLPLSTISMVAQRVSVNIAAIGQPMLPLRFWNLLFILFERILIDFLCDKLLLFPRVNHPHYLAITQDWSSLFTHLEREFSCYLHQHLANYVPLFYSYHKEPNKLFKQSYLYKILMPLQNLQLAWDSQWIANKLTLNHLYQKMPNHQLAIDQGIKHDNKKIYQQVKAFIHKNQCITHPLLQKIIEILRTWQQAPLHHWLIELTYNQRLYLAQNKREPYNSVDIIIEHQNYLILFNQHSRAYRSLDKLRWYRVYANHYAYTLVYYQYHQESEQFIRFA